jgi:HD-GYP domain-containing protein (c-di-GMP phosphodiesterase class II)
MGRGVAGHVADTGETVRVADAWDLDYFDRSWDDKHGFRTRSLICMPVCNRQHEIIGVIQVINKKGYEEFDEEDEHLLTALTSQVAIALENAGLMEEQKASFESFIRTLSATVDARHPLTAGHSDRVTAYSVIIGGQLSLSGDEMEALKYSALLHDIGKLGVPDRVLLKNGPFDSEERTTMNGHASKSREILANIRFPKILLNVPEYAGAHHERLDGHGYTEGLTYREIPQIARILAVADVFDALTSPRDYPKYEGEKIMSHAPMPLAKAVGIIRKDSGTAFDPRVVEAFNSCLPNILESQRGGHFPDEYIEAFLSDEEKPAELSSG